MFSSAQSHSFGYLACQRLSQAARSARAAIERRPDYPNAHYILAIALGHLGRANEARAALKQCERLQRGFLEKRAGWQPYRDPDRNAHLHEGLRKANLND